MGCDPCEEAARARRRSPGTPPNAARSGKTSGSATSASTTSAPDPVPAAPAAAEPEQAKATVDTGNPDEGAPRARRVTVVPPPEPRAGRLPPDAPKTVIPADPRVFSGQPKRHRFGAPLDDEGAPIVNAVPRVREDATLSDPTSDPAAAESGPSAVGGQTDDRVTPAEATDAPPAGAQTSPMPPTL